MSEPTYYKAFTHDLRPPIQGGDVAWDGSLPYLLPEVKVDSGEAECAAGWNATRSIADCMRIAGFWRATRAARDARDAWDVRDALSVYFTASMKWTKYDPNLLTTGIRDAYANGLLTTIPTEENELGYVMKERP